METEQATKANEIKVEEPVITTQKSSLKRHLIFFFILLAIIGAAILRSAIATRLDSFTFDEAYHIGSGVAYIKTHDFRLNPEHPPLVKLWVGAFVSNSAYQLSPYHPVQDKDAERDLVETDVYFNNDPFAIQNQARTAMFALNGLLLFLFALAAKRVFGDIVALAAVLFLAIDPTVAAHLPVVMTDLPVALTSATAVLFAVSAFRSWRISDLIFAALSLGLALSSKHSAIITFVAVSIIGTVAAIFLSKGASVFLRLKRLAFVAAVLVVSIVVLWGFYLFRFNESPGTDEENFNRPLAEKISDVKSPVYRAGLNAIHDWHLLPRAYTWGMADTIRAGAEGRAIPVRAFGSVYYSKAPFYFVPGIIAVKVPIGLLLLSVIGLCFLILRRVPAGFAAPIIGMAVLSGLFWIFLIKGSTYAGIRHAFPIIPLFALLAALVFYKAIEHKNYLLRGTVVVTTALALLSAIPVIRPWEYFNEFIGGTANGYRYFNDEGVDLSQRTGEMVDYYNQHLKPNGEIPFMSYFSPSKERRRRGFDWIGKDEVRDAEKLRAETINGTFMIGANELGQKLWWDVGKNFREMTPATRLGNVFIFRGTFPAPTAVRARSLYFQATYDNIYTNEPNIEDGIKILEESLALDQSAFFVALELGNQYLKLGKREDALRTYKIARDNAPVTDSISELLAKQVERVETEPLDQIEPLRNPGLE